jgi:hypothetical protein
MENKKWSLKKQVSYCGLTSEQWQLMLMTRAVDGKRCGMTRAREAAIKIR